MVNTNGKRKKIPKLTELRYGELFSGPGGLALGAMNAEAEKNGAAYKIAHQWANDYDSDACATYRRNIAPDKPESVICGDVRKLRIESLGPIDIFAFGFPCNDFSVVGEQKGFNGEYGPLYTYGVKVIKRFEPKFFVAENVGGLRSANDGKAFSKILEDLHHAGRGYTVTPHLYKFEEYGVPQRRHRIIIVGVRSDLQTAFRIPAPTTQGKYITAKEAITSPPISKDAPNNQLTFQHPRVIERLKHIKPGQNIWEANVPSHLALRVKSARMSQIYKRLDTVRPSYTVTGSGGRGTHIYHWKEHRALTNRERARLQTFPDDFVFEGSKESVRKQIGMAVPPRASEIIFRSILFMVAGKAYDYIDPNGAGARPELLSDQLKLPLSQALKK